MSRVLEHKAILAAYPHKQWKLSRPTVKIYAAGLMKGNRGWALEYRKGNGRPKPVLILTNELSRMWSYAREIPQSATKAINDKRIEGLIESDM